MAECTVAPVAMEDSDHEADLQSDSSGPESPELHHHPPGLQFCSQSKDEWEDSELEQLMRDGPKAGQESAGGPQGLRLHTNGVRRVWSGKSTLVHSLFLTDLYIDRKLLTAEERITQTVEITKHTVDIEEKGVKLKLTIVDTPGFGDAVNNTECWKPVADYIDQQFEQYFRDESGLNRKNIQDNRVHCCLYFISPFGHGYDSRQKTFKK
ncbi:hypothetical protein COCON_G00193070 [Conger conger]|uniref:Septin-type G domain-containing protein n=1 Tax=Conger conger TaxID=82655 RepID=A0A9Q1D3Y4_CONCO|nr:hypothetical protein COCON_G00193070 [Conger conger]